MSANSRALHFVLKVGNLKKNVEFFRDKLAMKVLRHEVFEQGCEAACNGPYAGKWSKTMIGYGQEDDYFVMELTYNYSVGSYKLGNDLQYIKIALKRDLFEKIHATESSSSNTNEQTLCLNSPDGYKFIISTNDSVNKQDVTEVCLSCSNLKKSIDYWVNLLKMKQYGDIDTNEALLRYADDQATLRLRQISEPIDHKSAYGRIAFSCPSVDLKPIQAVVEEAEQKVLTPYLSLDTPGKATVQVVILADPDGHEICFVGDEGFRELSKVDPEANNLIEQSMRDDKSDEWFEKKGIRKDEA